MTTVHRHDLDLLERLGGSDVPVHRAVVRSTGQVVVVKHASWDRPAAAARLEREAALLGRTRHPSVVRAHGLVDAPEGRALVLRHCPGGSLADEVAAGRRWAPADVADAGARVASGLAALHGAGVVHGDLHPGNVVLDAELQPVLIDLGEAVDVGSTAGSATTGHPEHIDHRLLAGHPASAATDLHALATTLWTVCTGEPPPRDGPAAPVRLRPHPSVPAPLHEVLRRCVDHEAGDPAAVAATLAALATDLRVGDGPVAVPSPPPAPRAPTQPATRRWGPPLPPDPRQAPCGGRVRHRHRLAAVGATLGLILALAGWAAAQQQQTPSPPGPAMASPSHADACTSAPGAGRELHVDLDGDGCAEPITLDADGVLRTPHASYRLGKPGDVLLSGDWDGDGRWGIGVYRPTTGAVLLIDDPGPGATSHPAEQHAPGGMPVVVPGSGGHRVTVDPPP